MSSIQAQIQPHQPLTDWGLLGAPVNVTDLGEIVGAYFSTRWQPDFRGSDQASVTIRPWDADAATGVAFRGGDFFELIVDGDHVFSGFYLESDIYPGDDGTITLSARGAAHAAWDYPAVKFVDADGPTDLTYGTFDCAAAYEWARSRGLPLVASTATVLSMPTVFGGTDVAERLSLLGDLFNAVWPQWYVDGRVLTTRAADTAPRWRYASGEDEEIVAVAASDHVTGAAVWYTRVDPPTSIEHWAVLDVYATNTQLARMLTPRIAAHDLRQLGVLTPAQVQDIVRPWVDERAAMVWSGSLRMTPGSGLQGPSGGDVETLSAVRAGEMIEVGGMRYSNGAIVSAGEDRFVIGETRWEWTADEGETLDVSPTGHVTRSIEDYVAEMERRASAAEIVMSGGPRLEPAP